MLKAYWLRLLLFALTGGALAAIVSFLMPKKYEAVVDLLIDQKPITTSVPLTSAESSVNDLIEFGRPRSLATTVQQLVSFGVVRTAAEKVAESMQMNPARLGSGEDLDPVALMQNISVAAEAQSDIVSLKVRMSKPELAQSVAGKIADAFDQQNLRNSTQLADQAIQSLRTQYDSIVAQIKETDTKIRGVRERAGTPDINVSISADIQLLSTLKNSRDQAKMELQAARERANSLRNTLSSRALRENVGDTKAINPTYQRIEQELTAARIELATLRERYTEEREEVKAAKQKVWQLLADRKNTIQFVPAQTTEGPSVSRETLRNQLAEADAAVVSIQARYADAQQIVAEKEAALKAMPAMQMELTELLRTQQALERLQLTYADRLKSLEVAKSGRLSPTRLVTAATAFPDPVSPRTGINLLFGVVAGLILGVLSMLATEAKRQPVRSLAQLNALALRPVYRMVPELRQPFRGLNKAPAEAFDSLLANYLRSTKRPYRVAIVGITKDAGASTAAANLAIAGARHGARTLIVQCDPKGSLARLLGKQPPAPGESAEVSSLIKGTVAETVLTVTGDRNPEISSEIKQFEGDLTIIDLEPTTMSAEYAFIAPHVDEVILLVRAGRAKSVEFLQAQQALKESGCPQVTVAFTRSSDLAVVTESVEGGETVARPSDAKPIEG